MSTHICGCDPEAHHQCERYPDCAYYWASHVRFEEASVPAHPDRVRANYDHDLKGIGGAPTRATTLPTTAGERKQYPVAGGVLDYFPDAIAAVAYVSWKGNDQHNPGQPLHWAREKSTDEAEAMMRHFLQRGLLDKDGVRHTAKMVWRALAMLQKELEQEQV